MSVPVGTGWPIRSHCDLFAVSAHPLLARLPPCSSATAGVLGNTTSSSSPGASPFSSPSPSFIDRSLLLPAPSPHAPWAPVNHSLAPTRKAASQLSEVGGRRWYAGAEESSSAFAMPSSNGKRGMCEPLRDALPPGWVGSAVTGAVGLGEDDMVTLFVVPGLHGHVCSSLRSGGVI